jgi:hypothetical protein
MEEPAQVTSDVLGTKDKIQILLAEYNTLRSEIITRGGTGFQIIAIAAGLLALLLQRQIDTRFVIGCIVLVAGTAAFTWIITGNIGKLSRRITEIEKDINKRAGETLLSWETAHGEAYGDDQVGIFGIFVRTSKKIDRWIQRRLRR